MDPTRPLQTPVAEVRAQAPVHVDGFGEAWVVIDGIETKVPNIKAARALLAQQDALRVKIRADLDERGIRFNPDGTDREEQVEITLEDGTKTTVGLLKPGDANYLQMELFPDLPGLIQNADAAQAKEDYAGAVAAAVAEHRRLTSRTICTKILDVVVGFLRKDPK
jgi:hypothetical protein